MSDLHSSPINLHLRKNTNINTQSDNIKTDRVTSDLSKDVTNALARALFETLRSQRKPGYQNIIDEINTLKNNIIKHGVNNNNNNNFEQIVYQLTHELSKLSKQSINIFLRTHLPQILQKLTLSNLTGANFADDKTAKSFMVEAIKHIAAPQDNMQKPETTARMQQQPAPAGPSVSSMNVRMAAPANTKTQTSLEQQKNILNIIKQEVAKYNDMVSIYSVLQKVKDKLSYSFSYNASNQKALIIPPNISNDDFNAIIKYFSATNPDFIDKFKTLHSLGQSADRQLLQTIIGLITTEQSKLQNKEAILVHKLTSNTGELAKIHVDLTAKGLAGKIVNLPPKTEIPTVANDTAIKQQEHDSILAYKNNYMVSANKLLEFKEILSFLRTLQALSQQQQVPSGFIKAIATSGKFTRLQLQLLQQQGIDIKALLKNPAGAISKIQAVISTLTTNANQAVAGLKQSTVISQTLKTEALKDILMTSQRAVANKLSIADSNINNILNIKMRRLNRILAVINAKKAADEDAIKANLGHINKQLALTEDDIKFLVLLNGGKQEAEIRNLLQSGDYKKFMEAVGVVNQIKNNLNFNYHLTFNSRIEQAKSLTDINSNLTSNGFTADVLVLTNKTQQDYINKLNLATQTLVETQKIVVTANEKQKLQAFVDMLTAAKNSNTPFNLGFLDSETLFLLRKYGIVSSSNYFTNAAQTGGKSDFDLVVENENQLQKDSSRKPGDIKFNVSDYQQLIAKITPVINRIKTTKTQDISSLPAAIKQNVIKNFINILNTRSILLARSTHKTTDVINDTLKASGAIAKTVKDSSDPTTMVGVIHQIAAKTKQSAIIKVDIDSDLISKLKASFFSKESTKLQTPQDIKTLQGISGKITSYKDGLLVQQHRYYYSSKQTEAELADIKTQFPSLVTTQSATSKLALYTSNAYTRNKADYMVFADHKESLATIKTVSDFINYLNKLKSTSKDASSANIKIDPKYLTPEIIFLLSKITGFTAGNNFFSSSNPSVIPANLQQELQSDLKRLVYNMLQPDASKKLKLEVKLKTKQQLIDLLTKLYQGNKKATDKSLTDAGNIKNPNILGHALKKQIFQLQTNVNSNQDARKEVLTKIRYLQRIMWKIIGPINRLDEDSKSDFSKSEVANKLGLKVQIELLSDEEVRWLSKYIDPGIIKRAIRSSSAGDLIVLKQKITNLWGQLQSNQQGIQQQIDDRINNEYTDIQQLVKAKHLGNAGILVTLETTNPYTLQQQNADLDTHEPYDTAKKYADMISRLYNFQAWIQAITFKSKNTDVVNISTKNISPELIKALVFKDSSSMVKKSVLEKVGANITKMRFFKDPQAMEDGSSLNLFPEIAHQKGLKKDFYFSTNNKLAKSPDKRFALTGASWKVGDLLRLAHGIQQTIEQLKTLEGTHLTRLHQKGNALLQPILREKALVLEYNYLVSKLNTNVDQVDELNNEKSSFVAMKLKIAKMYNEYTLHKGRPYGEFVTKSNIEVGLAKIMIEVLNLNKKFLTTHNITNLPTKFEDIVNLDKLPNKHQVLEDLYKGINLLVKKNSDSMTALITKQNETIILISEISEKLREIGLKEYIYGAVSLTAGKFAVSIFKQQYATATAGREEAKQESDQYLADTELFNKFHQIITSLLPLFFKGTTVSSSGISTKPLALPVAAILALKSPRIADMIHSFLPLSGKTNIARGQTTRVLPKGKNLFKPPTHFKNGQPINSTLQTALNKRAKAHGGNMDYSLIAYNLDHPDNPIVLESEVFTRAEAQGMSGNLGVLEKTLTDEAQISLSKLQDKELVIDNTVEVQIQFIKAFNKACLRLIAAIN